ncbi:hypothetical protein J8I26_15550 [Herbaspirillum sp. LeCh32-8]|nr:hypothetical protein [Herbaspirillum sp. LeCh32-8]
MCTNAQSIAGHHVLIIERLGEMSEQGEQVEHLVRATIRNCLTAMQTMGVDAGEAVEMICRMLESELALLPQDRQRLRNVLASAQVHAEYLLLTEQRAMH